jgi:hypothetical protein
VTATLATMQEIVAIARLTLTEIRDKPLYEDDVTLFLQSHSLALVEDNNAEEDRLRTKVINPFIECLLDSMDSRFSDKVMAMCTATSIFDPRQNSTDVPNSHAQLRTFLENIVVGVIEEFNVFRNNIAILRMKENVPSSSEVLRSLVNTSGVLSGTFPNLSILASIILLCPLGTPTVERSFSAMNRIETRLRQRLSLTNLEACMLISIEGKDKLSDEEACEILRIWHRQKERRIRIPLMG